MKETRNLESAQRQTTLSVILRTRRHRSEGATVLAAHELDLTAVE